MEWAEYVADVQLVSILEVKHEVESVGYVVVVQLVSTTVIGKEEEYAI
jgi:hypothetical protein